MPSAGLGPDPAPGLLKQGVLQSKGKDINEAQSTVTFLDKHLINHIEVLVLPDVTPVPALPPRGEFIIYGQFTSICVPLGPPQTNPKSTGGASFHGWCLLSFNRLFSTVGIKTPHCRGGRSGACRATDAWGRRSAGQRLQKLYRLAVSANIYVTPVTNNHLQGTHVLVKDTPAFLWGWREGTAQSAKASLAAAVAGPHTQGRSGRCRRVAGRNQGGTAALGHSLQTRRWLFFFFRQGGNQSLGS